MRSKEWFYGECLGLLRDTADFNGLAWRALDLGVRGQDNTRGHMTHSIGVAQKFLEDHPEVMHEINEMQLEPFDLGLAENDEIRQVFVQWIGPKAGEFGRVGRHRFGYNYGTFKNVMTPQIGGTRVDGGGGNNEFHIALRLVSHFLE